MNTDAQEMSANLSSEDQNLTEHIVQPARLAPLTEISAPTPPRSIEFLYDIQLQLSVELGRTEMSVREIMNLGIGAVIELNKLAGEPVDVLVNGKPIARAEVVVVDDMFGVRIIDVLSPKDRLNSLR